MSDASDVKPSHPIVFFDGYCGLCDRSVTYLFKHDPRHALRFAPLQGRTAAAQLSAAQRLALDTIVYVEDGVTYERSTAVLRAVRRTGGGVALFSRFALAVPRPVRDFVYNVVAANRYGLFGKKDSCRLPAPHERAYFLE